MNNSDGPLYNQTWQTNDWLQQKVFVLTQLHVGQWSSLPFCLPSLIAQWSIRIFHFYPLYVIVKLAFYVTENYSKYVINFCLSLDFCLKTYDYMQLIVRTDPLIPSGIHHMFAVIAITVLDVMKNDVKKKSIFLKLFAHVLTAAVYIS